MVLFVGPIEQGYFIEDFSEVVYTGKHTTIFESLNEFLNAKSYDYIVIDVTCLAEHYTEQIKEIEKIKIATNATIIVMAVGFDKKSTLLSELRQIGIENFILSPILSIQKSEFEQALNGISTGFSEDFVKQPEPISDKPVSENNFTTPKQRTIISIVGACNRIGTTTQAIQIIKYLMLQGYSAAYVEMNDNRYVERLQRLYDVTRTDEDTAVGRVTYQNVAMYHKKEKIADVLRQPYDYFIYDFGAFTDRSFNLISFLEKDIGIIVGGSKPNEMEFMGNIISKTIISDVFYIFSFCPDSERNEILELMQEKSEKTTFANYTPDPFLYAADGEHTYKKIIEVPKMTENEERTSKKHFSFFRRNKHG